jgi:hypothetical protein
LGAGRPIAAGASLVIVDSGQIEGCVSRRCST